MSTKLLDSLVIGAGPAGLTAALMAAQSGATVGLAGTARPSDRRTSGLMNKTIGILQRAKAFSRIAQLATPITGIRIIDQTNAFLRAPETLFSAADVGLDSFGYNIANATLVAALDAALMDVSNVEVFDNFEAVSVTSAAEFVSVTSADGRKLNARVVIGADGRNSICRQSAGIASKTWDYQQSAIVASFDHSLPHDGISTEFYRDGGPLTTVPAQGNSSNLVWVERTPAARRYAELNEDDFVQVLRENMQGLLGKISELRGLAVFPLKALTVNTMAQNRIALVGEAAHVLPPIGAQGLNLGLQDAAAIADAVSAALLAGEDPGSPATLARYRTEREGDVKLRSNVIDALNWSLLSAIAPVHLLRGAGLVLANVLPPLRRQLIKAGLGTTTT